MLAMLPRVCTILFCVTLFSNLAYALHEIDHRFTISGYVRDNTGETLSGKNIAVKDLAGGTLGKAISGPSGFYSIRLHLHSEDVGRKLEVSTGTQTQEIQVKFDPDNVKDERTVEVNFGAKGVAIPLWESPMFLAVSAAVIIGGVVYLFASQRQRSNKGKKHGGSARKKRKK